MSSFRSSLKGATLFVSPFTRCHQRSFQLAVSVKCATSYSCANLCLQWWRLQTRPSWLPGRSSKHLGEVKHSSVQREVTQSPSPHTKQAFIYKVTTECVQVSLFLIQHTHQYATLALSNGCRKIGNKALK